MNKRLFVGNLPFSVDDTTLSEIFSAAGAVVSAKVITDKFTNRSRGFGFVEMSSEEETGVAIKKLAEFEVDGRKLAVNIAKPLEERPRRDFNSGGGYGNRGGDHRGNGGYSRGGSRGGGRSRF